MSKDFHAWIKPEWIKTQQDKLTELKREEPLSISLVKFRREVAAYCRALLLKNRIPEKKFIIFGQPRTGSTLLADLLNSHPNVFCEGEILNAKTFKIVKLPNLYVQGRCIKTSNKIYGFKALMYQLIEEHCIDPGEFVNTLNTNNWTIINVVRQNYLRSIISSKVAAARNKWHFHSQDLPRMQKINVDPDLLLQCLEKRELYIDKESEILSKIQHIRVVYETDLLLPENHQSTCDRIFEALEVNSVKVKSKLVKTTANELSDVIENYDEIASKIGKTKYAQFLEG